MGNSGGALSFFDLSQIDQRRTEMMIQNATRKDLARTLLKVAAATLGLVVCSTVFIQTARADCGSYPSPGQKPLSAPTQRPLLKPVTFRLATLAAATRDDDRDAAIVGMWKVQFVSEGTTGIPDGTVIDSAYAQWHSDGTEIMNSGRPPITSSFCLGVWKKTGESTYKLNHFALSWDPTGTVFVGPANIRENVTLDDNGNSFSGTFTIDQFDTNGNTLAHIAGKITAQRVTPD
jgi:hypothetical protein